VRLQKSGCDCPLTEGKAHRLPLGLVSQVLDGGDASVSCIMFTSSRAHLLTDIHTEIRVWSIMGWGGECGVVVMLVVGGSL
jgi:hypothetical protein